MIDQIIVTTHIGSHIILAHHYPTIGRRNERIISLGILSSKERPKLGKWFYSNQFHIIVQEFMLYDSLASREIKSPRHTTQITSRTRGIKFLEKLSQLLVRFRSVCTMAREGNRDRLSMH